jgi:hypothetical protein
VHQFQKNSNAAAGIEAAIEARFDQFEWTRADSHTVAADQAAAAGVAAKFLLAGSDGANQRVRKQRWSGCAWQQVGDAWRGADP